MNDCNREAGVIGKEEGWSMELRQENIKELRNKHGHKQLKTTVS